MPTLAVGMTGVRVEQPSGAETPVMPTAHNRTTFKFGNFEEIVRLPRK